jgi:hypothetical protein
MGRANALNHEIGYAKVKGLHPNQYVTGTQPGAIQPRPNRLQIEGNEHDRLYRNHQQVNSVADKSGN